MKSACLLALALHASMFAAEQTEPEAKKGARLHEVVIHAPGRSTYTTYTHVYVPGEWAWIAGSFGSYTPYRQGSDLRFDWEEPRLFVQIDGRPRQLAGVVVTEGKGLAELREAITQGTTPITIWWRRKTFEGMPRVAQSVEVALVASYGKEPLDFAGLGAALPGLTGLHLVMDAGYSGSPRGLVDLGKLPGLRSFHVTSGPSLSDPLTFLSELKDLRALSIDLHYGTWEHESSLNPIGGLPKLTSLRLEGQLHDDHLESLRQVKELVSLVLTDCCYVTHLAPFDGPIRASAIGSRELPEACGHWTPGPPVEIAGPVLAGLLRSERSGSSRQAERVAPGEAILHSPSSRSVSIREACTTSGSRY